MKTIDTLIPDIQDALSNGIEVDGNIVNSFGDIMKNMMSSRLKTRDQKEFRIGMSNFGSPCVRKLWLSKYNPEKIEKMQADAYLKFLYGDIIEEVILYLAEATGHSVKGRQDTLHLHGIEGHRDAIIDGVLVDVKSTSTFSFEKFKNGKLSEDDPFGYIVQLQSYLEASQNDPDLIVKDRAAFLAVDKTLGHMHLDWHAKADWDFETLFKIRHAILNDKDTLPEIPDNLVSVPEGKSGNMKLCTFCSYCNVKSLCYPELRTFVSSRGPLYLTRVEREPSMLEITE